MECELDPASMHRPTVQPGEAHVPHDLPKGLPPAMLPLPLGVLDVSDKSSHNPCLSIRNMDGENSIAAREFLAAMRDLSI
jgi:hypothetical protein